MKGLFTAAFVCCLWLASSAWFSAPQARSNSSIAGQWLTEKRDGILLIEPRRDELVGKLVWVKDRDGIKGTERLDAKNPNPDLRSRQVLGLVILTGVPLSPDENGQFRGGRIYNPKSGKMIPIRLELESADVIKARVGTSVLHKTIRWTRVTGDSPDV
jgi:uncharacterized protein (DUF2147 family)